LEQKICSRKSGWREIIIAPVSFVVGIVAGIFIRKIPMRGWVAVLLLILSALCWTFSEPNDSAVNERTWLLPCFMFIAPVAIIYSFRARKSAPDRLFARAAFFASFLIAIALLFMLFGMIDGFILVLSHPGALQSTN